jgi:hypothetical protein
MARVLGELGSKSPARKRVNFFRPFVAKQTEVDALSQRVATQADGDTVVWFGYPKSTAKSYEREVNRDSGRGMLRRRGLEPVHRVAIDARTPKTRH